MSVYQGKDLFVSANGTVLAGSKSCELSIDADTLEVASQVSGQWREFIADRKSWHLTTNHLLLNEDTANLISASCHDGVARLSYPSGSGDVVSEGIVGVAITSRPSAPQEFDLSTEIGREYFTNWLEMYEDTSTVLMVAGHDFVIDEGLKWEITEYLHVDVSSWQVGTRSNAAFIIQPDKGCIASFTDTPTAGAHVNAFINGGIFSEAQCLTRFADMVSRTFDLRLQVQGYVDDNLCGRAICKRFKVTATNGNLMQGSFEWQGTGPLLPV